MQLWNSPDFPDTDVRCEDDLNVLGERHRGTRDRRLAEDEESASIDDAHEHTRRNCEQKHRQTVRNLHHRGQERVRIKARHEPAGDKPDLYAPAFAEKTETQWIL